MRICVDMGHTPASTGAVGMLNELNEDRAIGRHLIDELRRRGHEVIDTTPPDYVAYPTEINHRVTKANSSGADVFVSIHLNAGGGTGTEVLYYSGDGVGLALARQISANVAAVLGLQDRGAKPRTNEVGVIRDTNMTAVLVETCFVDSARDKAAFDAVSYQAIANAIADGIEAKATSGGGGGGASKPAEPSAPAGGGGDVPAIWLQAQTTDGTVLPWTTYPDFAGWRENGPIAYLCAKCDWPLDVQAHAGGRWWGELRNPSNINDKANGCVGNGDPITGLKMYLHSPNGNKVAAYRVAVGSGYYDWQRDTETGGGQDGYAGDLRSPIYEVQAIVKDW